MKDKHILLQFIKKLFRIDLETTGKCREPETYLKDDFCSFTFLFPLSNGGFAKTETGVFPSQPSEIPSAMQRVANTEFLNEGTPLLLPELSLDLDAVYDDFQMLILLSAEIATSVKCICTHTVLSWICQIAEVRWETVSYWVRESYSRG